MVLTTTLLSRAAPYSGAFLFATPLWAAYIPPPRPPPQGALPPAPLFQEERENPLFPLSMQSILVIYRV